VKFLYRNSFSFILEIAFIKGVKPCVSAYVICD
jgi:hypothetical protein